MQVICEVSGGYERALVEALHGAGFKVSVVQANPSNRLFFILSSSKVVRGTGVHPRPAVRSLTHGNEHYVSRMHAVLADNKRRPKNASV